MRCRGFFRKHAQHHASRARGDANLTRMLAPARAVPWDVFSPRSLVMRVVYKDATWDVEATPRLTRAQAAHAPHVELHGTDPEGASQLMIKTTLRPCHDASHAVLLFCLQRTTRC